MHELPYTPGRSIQTGTSVPYGGRNPLVPARGLLRHGTLVINVIVGILRILTNVTIFFVANLGTVFLSFSFATVSILSKVITICLSSHAIQAARHFPGNVFTLRPVCTVYGTVFAVSLLICSLVSIYQMTCSCFIFKSNRHVRANPIIVCRVLAMVIYFDLCACCQHSGQSVNSSDAVLATRYGDALISKSVSFNVNMITVFLVLLPTNNPLSFLRCANSFFVAITLITLAVGRPFDILGRTFIRLINNIRSSSRAGTCIRTRTRHRLPTGASCRRALVFGANVGCAISICLDNVNRAVSMTSLVRYGHSLRGRLDGHLRVISISFIFS